MSTATHHNELMTDPDKKCTILFLYCTGCYTL